MACVAGRTNVGKSTLINALVACKVTITSRKPQTTRYPIRGIVNRPEGQVVLVDTPGVCAHDRDELTRALHRVLRDSLHGTGLVLHVVDPSRSIRDEENRMAELVAGAEEPKILVINKMDLPNLVALDEFRERGRAYDETVEVSALKQRDLGALLDAMFRLMPEGPPLYPTGQLTDTPPRLWAAELIREKIFHSMRQELPYVANVEVRETAERPNGVLYCKAEILITHKKHRGMFIGKDGRKIAEVGRAARREMEAALNRRVYLDLDVVVDRHWPERLREAL